MSAVVANPARRVENAFYLAFSFLLITNAQYVLGMDPPNLIVTAVLRALAAALLLYPAPNRWFLNWKPKGYVHSRGRMPVSAEVLLHST